MAPGAMRSAKGTHSITKEMPMHAETQIKQNKFPRFHKMPDIELAQEIEKKINRHCDEKFWNLTMRNIQIGNCEDFGCRKIGPEGHY